MRTKRKVFNHKIISQLKSEIALLKQGNIQFEFSAAEIEIIKDLIADQILSFKEDIEFIDDVLYKNGALQHRSNQMAKLEMIYSKLSFEI